MLEKQSSQEYNSCLLTIEAHPGTIKSVTVSEDGQIIVNGSDENIIKVWDFKTGEVIHTQTKNHNTHNYQFGILSPDGLKHIVCSYSCDDYKTVVWDWEMEWEIYTSELYSFSLQYEWDHEHLYIPGIKSVEISPGGKTIVISYDYDNTKSGGCVCSLSEVVNLETGHSFTVNDYSHGICWDISRNGQTIVSRSSDNTIKAWKKTYKNLEWIKESIERKYGYDTLSPGEHVDTDEVMANLDFQTIRVCRTIEQHSGVVTCLAISEDGKTLVSGSADNTIKLCDLQSGQVIHTLEGHSAGVTCLAISEDGKTLVSGSTDNTIKLWNFQTGQIVCTLEGHSAAIKSVAISPDEQIIFSQSDDNTIKVWELRLRTEKQDFMETELRNEIDIMNPINERQIAREQLDNILLALEAANQLDCMDDSIKQALRYQVRKIIWNDIIQPDLPSEWRTSDRAMYLGYSPTRTQSIAIGKAAAKLYREKYSEDPPQSELTVDGETRLINVYLGKALDLLDTAIHKVMES